MNAELIYSLVTVLISIMVIVYIIYRGNMNLAKTIVYSFVTEAEKKFGSSTGPIKYEYVISKAYPILPPIVRFFVDEKQLDTLVEDAVNKLKEALKE